MKIYNKNGEQFFCQNVGELVLSRRLYVSPTTGRAYIRDLDGTNSYYELIIKNTPAGVQLGIDEENPLNSVS